jgi:Flp pilus assembly protein TadD
VLRLEHRPDQAVLVLRQALLRWPNQANLHAGLGVALRTAGKNAEAVPVLREALRLDPSLVEARYNLGYCLLALGEKNAARTEVQQALLMRPDYPDALLFMSSLAIQEGDTAAAEPHVNRLYSLQPDEPDTQVLFAVLQMIKGTAAAEAGDTVQAETFYRAGLAVAPDFVPLLREAGLLAARLGHWPQAITALEHCVRLTPADSQAYLLLGNTLRSAGRTNDSRQILGQGLAVAQKAGDQAGAEEFARLLNR